MANAFRKAAEFLGLVEGEQEYEEHEPQARVERPVQPAPAAQSAPASRAQVTPITRARAAQPQRGAAMNEILTVHPRTFSDVQTIAEHFREGVPVIINISQMPDGEARRLIDFACGLSAALLGRIERVTAKVFLLSPEHIVVSGEQADAVEDVEASFFATTR